MHYRGQLPQLLNKPFMTDGGLETSLIYLEGLNLPEFAAIDLMRSKQGRHSLEKYYRSYLELARKTGHNFILESPTWRASSDWVGPLGYSHAEMDQYNQSAIYLMSALKKEYASANMLIVLSGCVGPRSDGYQPTLIMSARQAQTYHSKQIELFADAGVDCITAMNVNYVDEAIGIVWAAKIAKVPAVISFTVETDGNLISGESLGEAILIVDAATKNGAAYYMVNCAHPAHFERALACDESWVTRIKGIRANASKCSHAELDIAEELDSGDPEELASDYRRITAMMPHINIVSGCCGTDIRHLEKIAGLHSIAENVSLRVRQAS